ncbi:Glycosyl transferase family 2 [Butyrivibrio proteoclasticus]|uniref:Glycosyl transferase family 2 n=1 Tax=Butyrivibrio proteoclasticus TaxID=43305 RepID=A0A1I5PQX7_9FIRM|nr:glycosyltransferase family 2 protein [Butyrivibrio proteoclasticus]SFP36415.1 Glycosyl transferase family 2 [Butyrivibrio proteoclasticus]
MASPLFTVITVCYNSEKTIERTLQSVLNQTEQDYEYLIIDGASTDGTLDVVRRYEPKFRGRLHIFSEKDNGIYDAMNKGIAKASGELIGLVNSDDFYEFDALENMKKVYMEWMTGEDNKNNHHVILYGMQRRLRGGEEIEIEFVNHRILGEGMICHPTCFVSREVYREFGAYDTNYKSAADLDFLLRIKNNTDTTFVPVYHIISNFELGGMSASGRGAREAARVRCKYGVYSRTRMNYVILQSRIIDFVHWVKRL